MYKVITIKNYGAAISIKIVSDLGADFIDGLGYPTLTCMINDSEEKGKYEQLKELKTQVSEIIKDRKEKMKQFADLQKSLFAYMDDQDAKLAELEEKISQIQGDEELGQAIPENKQPENNGEER